MDTPTERVAPGESIVVEALDGTPKRRTTVRFDVASTVSRATVHNNSLPNILRGLRERVFAVEGRDGLQLPPRPAAGVFEKRMANQRADMVSLLRGCQPITPGKFLEHYRGAKLARYSKAVEANAVEQAPRSSSFLSTFVKGEFLNLDAKTDPAPRVIQPRHPRYNAALGVYIQPLEFRAYRVIAKLCGGPTVMKGYNADQTGQIMAEAWGQFDDPVGVSLDASRFDQHVSVDALRFEHSIYLGAYSGIETDQMKELKRLLKWQVENVGIARLPEAVVKYEVKGNRMSGDMNTALGNCILMCLMVRAYCMERSVGFRLMDNGDDATVLMERKDLSKFMDGLKPWFLELGFTMKVEDPVDVLERVEFCQTHPVNVNGKYRMVRNPLTALSKDTLWKQPGYTASGSIDPKAANTWLRAVGECGMSLCSGVPVMQDFYAYMLSHGGGGKRAQGFGTGESGFERMAAGLSRGSSDISPESRVSFWLAFGILPDAQALLERRFKELQVAPISRHRIEGDSLNRLIVPTVFIEEFA